MSQIRKAQYVASDDLVYETIRTYEQNIKKLEIENSQLTLRVKELSKGQNRVIELDDELKRVRK